VQPDHQPYTDEELAAQVQAGSSSAFEQLVVRHQAGLYRFLCSCCHNETDARELTQDAFVAAYSAIRRFNRVQSFAPWLFTIARRKFYDHCRSRRLVLSQDLPEQPDLADPATLLSDREAVESIWRRARRLLPDNQFQSLWLKYQQDMNVREIAQILRLTQVHVKVLLFRARQTLIRALHQGRPRENPNPKTRSKPGALPNLVTGLSPRSPRN